MALYTLGVYQSGLFGQDMAFYKQAYGSSSRSGYILHEWPSLIVPYLSVMASAEPLSVGRGDFLKHSVGEAKRVIVLSLAPQQFSLRTMGYKFA